jgi:hypothetical protein
MIKRIPPLFPLTSEVGFIGILVMGILVIIWDLVLGTWSFLGPFLDGPNASVREKTDGVSPECLSHGFPYGLISFRVG